MTQRSSIHVDITVQQLAGNETVGFGGVIPATVEARPPVGIGDIGICTVFIQQFNDDCVRKENGGADGKKKR